jgi:hypothetical protein
MISHVSEVLISRGRYPSIPRAAAHIQSAVALGRKVEVSEAEMIGARAYVSAHKPVPNIAATAIPPGASIRDFSGIDAILAGSAATNERK